MTLLPVFKFSLWNLWVPTLGFYLIFGLLLWIFPREVVRRLYDRSHWTPQQNRRSRLPKLLGVVMLILCFFIPHPARTAFLLARPGDLRRGNDQHCLGAGDLPPDPAQQSGHRRVIPYFAQPAVGQPDTHFSGDNRHVRELVCSRHCSADGGSRPLPHPG